MSDADSMYVCQETTILRCTKGHEWEQSWGGPVFWALSFGRGLEIKDLCPCCLKERVEELLADVGRRR